MEQNNMVLVIDAGNTAFKISWFENDRLVEVHRWEKMNFFALKKWFDEKQGSGIIVSSVLGQEFQQEMKTFFPQAMIVNHQTSFPIAFDYKTPQTLGIDRICNVVGVHNLNPDQNSLSIDVGTCVKFDLINAAGVYLGGSISPGIHLRYKSLNDYTANLPLLQETGKIQLVGQSTTESIHSGVINGMDAEINYLIERYTAIFNDLSVFITGGDARFFDFGRKNNIFADENLTLKGLYQIYLFNAK